MAQVCYDEVDIKKDDDIINKTMQNILGRYKTEFVKCWCSLYTSNGKNDLAIYIVHQFINTKNMNGQDYNYAKGIIFSEIAYLLPNEYIEHFPLIIAEALIAAKLCTEKKSANSLVKKITFLFRQKNITDKQVLSVFNHFDDTDTKDWSIWSILGQGYSDKEYELRFQIILEYDEYNYEVIIDDLTFLIEDIKENKEINDNDIKEYYEKFKLYTYEKSFSEYFGKRIIKLLKNLLK